MEFNARPAMPPVLEMGPESTKVFVPDAPRVWMKVMVPDAAPRTRGAMTAFDPVVLLK